ncbi:class I adenylate-forming enzyme family protein [Actinocorallia sp. A-T 12471]|uniref:class I adenylate-forming enzyme family protein n=1 Tax=Actinocorallia sp. A-T 12471 TaxID=3089813 RepID=UPI0029D0E7CB|nr:AMP-binding protein [Actinocorallia sp. A-T 12471]MDX6741495.1 AMP-binding protein [Actinocorallia sp. A-T 12471]
MSAVEGVPFGVRLRELADAEPEALALVVVDAGGAFRSLTRRAVDEGANRWCRALGLRGAGAGDRVALAVPNSVDLVLAALGVWKAGAVPVPVRWDLPDWERGRVLAAIDPAVVVDGDRLAEFRDLAAAQEPGAVPDLTSPQHSGICSSGATGTPKVIVNERPALWSPELSRPFLEHWEPVARPQTILVPGPMYHTNGFATLNSLLGGDVLVVLERFDAALVLDVIERHAITTFTATPTMLQRIAAVEGVAGRDLSSLRWILQGAAVMPPGLLRTWFDLLSPEQVVMAYGMTENLGLTALRGDEWLAHPGSVGRGSRGTEIRILDGNLDDVPVGELGEIYLRSPASGTYSYRGGAARLPATEDGFASGGDIGRLDEDGYLYIADRRVDMIVTGGANVFPAEVESALIEHPGIADVVVIGLADERWGRRVHAVVEPSAGSGAVTEAEVVSFARARLAAYKVPKTVELVDRIPRTAATKVNRSAMVREREGRVER